MLQNDLGSTWLNLHKLSPKGDRSSQRTKGKDTTTKKEIQKIYESPIRKIIETITINI